MNARGKAAITWFLVISCVALCYVSLWAIIQVWYPNGLSMTQVRLHFIHFSIIYLAWMLVFFIQGMFDVRSLHSARRIILNILSAMSVNLVIAIAYFYFQPSLVLTPRRFLLIHVALTLILFIAWFFLVRYFMSSHLTERLHILSVGDGNDDELVAELRQYEFMGVHIAGTVDESGLKRFTTEQGPIHLVIPDTHRLTPHQLQQLYALRSQSVTFYNYRTLYETLSRKIYLGSLTEIWFLENVNYRRRAIYGFCKRIIDMVVGVLGLLVLAVIYAPVALLIKLTSVGPVFFRQPRIGQYDTIFMVYKFRTMSVADNAGNTWTARNDSRITPVGRFLRRTRIDELPQSLNLLLGDMSLVGPRPEQPHIVEQLNTVIPFYNERHAVKPGLTGWGQLNVYARTVEDSKAKLQYDLYYIKHRSFFFDLEIILKTFYHIFTSSDT